MFKITSFFFAVAGGRGGKSKFFTISIQINQKINFYSKRERVLTLVEAGGGGGRPWRRCKY